MNECRWSRRGEVFVAIEAHHAELLRIVEHERPVVDPTSYRSL